MHVLKTSNGTKNCDKNLSSYLDHTFNFISKQLTVSYINFWVKEYTRGRHTYLHYVIMIYSLFFPSIIKFT